MAKYAFLPLLAAAVLFGQPVFAAEQAAPTLSIEQALKIGQDYLHQKGLADRFVAGVTLEKATPSTSYWWVRWSASIREGKKTETGLRVDMDGSITRFVSGSVGSDASGVSGTSPGPYEAPKGQRPVGARSIR